MARALLIVVTVLCIAAAAFAHAALSAPSDSRMRELDQRIIGELNDRYCSHCEDGVGDCMKVAYYDAMEEIDLLAGVGALIGVIALGAMSLRTNRVVGIE